MPSNQVAYVVLPEAFFHSWLTDVMQGLAQRIVGLPTGYTVENVWHDGRGNYLVYISHPNFPAVPAGQATPRIPWPPPGAPAPAAAAPAVKPDEPIVVDDRPPARGGYF